MNNTDLNWEKLKNWLSTKSLKLDLSFKPERFKKGMGNLNYKILLNEKFAVIRRPPLGPLPPGANDMKREHTVMSALSKKLYLVPNSLILCEDSEIFGAPFHIIDFMEGETIEGGMLPAKWNNKDTARHLSKILIELLVKLHAIKPESLGLENFGKPQGFLDRQLKGWYNRGCIAQNNNPSKIMTDLYNLLNDKKIPEEKEYVILHNDFKLDNIMVSSSSQNNSNLHPTAILDWDQATKGHPLYDLATLLSYWTTTDDTTSMKLLKQMPSAQEGFLDRSKALKLYAELSGRNMENFNWIYTLSLLKLGVVFQQLYAQFQRGTVTDIRYKDFGKIAEAAFERGLKSAENKDYI